MEMCLYHPHSGYYTSPREKIGANGDFFTTATLTSVFGAMIGRQLEEMWLRTGKQEFAIIEYGAGTGMLCRDILAYLENNPAFYALLKYYIIEKSPAMQHREKSHLTEKVEWIGSIYDIEPVTGCVLSNELVDNFAIHQVERQEALMEVRVSYDQDFVEQLIPAREEIHDYLRELKIDLPVGFRAEINLEATKWIKDIARCLRQGYVITIDYGYTSSELYSARCSSGTLLCYHKHEINDNPYINIGDQDITTHINFSALTHWGNKHGLTTCGLITQAAFFAALDFDDYLQQLLSSKQDRLAAIRQYALLKRILLLDMGQRFRVLVQQKGVDDAELKCFKGSIDIH